MRISNGISGHQHAQARITSAYRQESTAARDGEGENRIADEKPPTGPRPSARWRMKRDSQRGDRGIAQPAPDANGDRYAMMSD